MGTSSSPLESVLAQRDEDVRSAWVGLGWVGGGGCWVGFGLTLWATGAAATLRPAAAAAAAGGMRMMQEAAEDSLESWRRSRFEGCKDRWVRAKIQEFRRRALKQKWANVVRWEIGCKRGGGWFYSTGDVRCLDAL